MGVSTYSQFKPTHTARIGIYISQSGGMIVDDAINNVRYCIERDGTITNMVGVKHVPAIYDEQDASMLSDTVQRILGSDHPYANPTMFIQEYITMSESDGGVPATTGMGDGMGPIVFPSGCENGFNTGGPGSTIGSGDIPCCIGATRKRKRKRGKNHILDYHTYIQQQSAQVI